MKNLSAVILAAGCGTRMNSNLPKVMHKLSDKPLLEWVINSVSKLNPHEIIVILGHKADIIEAYLSSLNNKIKVVYQDKQLGSAHALVQAQKVVDCKNDVLVLSGDVPLIKTNTLLTLINQFRTAKVAASVLSADVENPFGYGRIIKEGPYLQKIVEEKDANEVQKQIKEINAGIYCFDKSIWEVLLKIKPNNAKKEYYLTDSIEILKNEGKNTIVSKAENIFETQGINNRKELMLAEKFLQNEKMDELFANGVTVVEPSSTYISYDANIGKDTIIYPGAFISTNVLIGQNCVILGNSFIKNSKIADNVNIEYSYIDGADIKNNVKIGPFSHIRPGSILKENVKIGNFSETKKSIIEKNSKVNHLSYIGDCEIGENVNIGAGTITCNYDGKNKHKTIIGDNSFVGSNVNFVAPVKVGKNTLIAAGSTITKDIPNDKLAIARVRQEVKTKLK